MEGEKSSGDHSRSWPREECWRGCWFCLAAPRLLAANTDTECWLHFEKANAEWAKGGDMVVVPAAYPWCHQRDTPIMRGVVQSQRGFFAVVSVFLA
jgi:hypothetical protein